MGCGFETCALKDMRRVDFENPGDAQSVSDLPSGIGEERVSFDHKVNGRFGGEGVFDGLSGKAA